jgi:hypothetical protein
LLLENSASLSFSSFTTHTTQKTPFPTYKRLIGVLLSAGAPVVPAHLPRVLPIAAEHAERREQELAERRELAEPCTWRAHEAMVGLALDMGELRQAAQAVEERQARVAALERRLGELGIGSGSDSDSGSESEDESESGGDGGSEGQ